MRHANNCTCVNCNAKGKPMNEVFLAAATAADLAAIEIFDWLEGYGQVLSLAEQKYIRHYGFLLIKLQKEKMNHDEITNHHNRIINGLNHDNRIQVNRLRKNREIIEALKEQNIKQVCSQANDIKDCVAKQLKIRRLKSALANLHLRDAEKWTQLKTDLAIALEQRTADWQRIKDLEKEQSQLLAQLRIKNEAIVEKLDAECHDRVHDLEEENGMYFEKLGDYEKQIENLNAVINKLAGQIP